MEEYFNFKYPKDGKWFVQKDGKICVRSALSPVFQPFEERDKSIFMADDSEYYWRVTQLDALLELLKNAKKYNPYKDIIQWRPSD